MIEIKNAVVAAEKFARAVFDNESLLGLRLEEVEVDPSDEAWKITLGWVDASRQPLSAMGGILAYSSAPRVYKTFVVDGRTGQVRSMKIRETS